MTNDSITITPTQRRTASDYAALAIATCGVGFMPVAPGTWGSMVGVCVFLLLRFLNARLFVYAATHNINALSLEAFRTTVLLGGLIALTLVGVWAASRAETLLHRKDPGAVVVDEVAGQLITLLVVPFNASWQTILAGFLLFRVFDIWKPYPVRQLESLPSGLGIMADDVLAGAYAAAILSIVVWISFLL